MKTHLGKMRQVSIHALLWISFAVFNHLLNMIIYSYSAQDALISDTVVKYLIAAAVFYVNYLFIAPCFFKPKKYGAFLFALFVLSIISFAVKELLFEILFSAFDNFNGPYNLKQAYFLNLWWWLIYSILGFLFWSRQEGIANEREKRMIEREHSRLENAYLKAQINPHFLNNVLNFFYSKSLGVSEELSEGIVYLADIMRYACNSGEDANGYISLDEEIQQIKNVIGINQLRYHNSLNINFNLAGNFCNIKIIPFVMITIVENAFKHGLLTDAGTPLEIDLQYNETTKVLSLFVSNKKTARNQEVKGGVGIENIKRRLEHTYGTSHSLTITEDTDFYSTTLKITI